MAEHDIFTERKTKMKKTMLFAAAAALAGCASVCSTSESVAKPRPEGKI